MSYTRNSSYATQGDTDKDLPLLSGIAAHGTGGDYSNPYAQPQMREAGRPGSLAYQNVPSETYWPTSSGGAAGFTAAAPRKSRKKWLIIGGVILGLAAIGGIVAGVVISQTKKGSAAKSSGSSSAGDNSVLKNPNDPSVFDKDSRLHQSMWGLAYTPQVSTCHNKTGQGERNAEDSGIYTSNVRLYSSQRYS